MNIGDPWPNRTLLRWKHQIAAWHHSHVSNGPTEAVIIWSG
jgi:transposase